MNILWINSATLSVPCRGGIERAVEICVREMARRGHANAVLAWEKSGSEPADITQWVFPQNKFFGSPENVAYFSEILRKFAANIVVFQCAGGVAFPFAEETKAAGVPVVSVIHTDPLFPKFHYMGRSFGWWKTFHTKARLHTKYRFNYEHSACTVVLTERLKAHLQAYLSKAQIAENRIAVIGNASAFPPVPVDFFEKAKELLFVGRMDFSQKRPNWLLDVWMKLQSRFPDWKLRFVGDGKYFAKLQSLAKELGAERVEFCGAREPEPYYRTASVFCMTSAYEPWGITLLEAASFGCAIVAFDNIAPEIAGENRVALVPAFDLDKYAETLAKLMSDSALRERLAKNALAQIPEKFSPKKIGDKWEKLLFETCLKEQ